jgi:hypothetical protein
MNKFKIFVFFSLLISFSFVQKDNRISNLCEQMGKVPKNSIYSFDLKYLSKVKKNRLKQLNNNTYELLFESKPTDYDKAYIISQFKISESRKGLLLLNCFAECDSQKKEIILFIIEKCKHIAARYQVSYEDNEGTVYEVSSKLSLKNDLLTINVDTSSEWSSEYQSDIDTIFSDKYKIKLSSLKFDTIQKKSFLKRTHHLK